MSRWHDKLESALKRRLRTLLEDDAVRTAIDEAVPDALSYALTVDEDVLTALLFERLRYLPAKLAWNIVVEAAEALRGSAPSLADDGDIDVETWPRFPLSDHADVIPDVLWKTPTANPRLIVGIEVKWRDKQTAGQIQREHDAIHLAHPECQIVMLALGGASQQGRADLRAGTTCPNLLFMSWATLASRLRRARDLAKPGSPERFVIADTLSLLSLRSPVLGRELLTLDSMPAASLSFDAARFPRLASDPRRYLASLATAHFSARPWEDWKPL